MCIPLSARTGSAGLINEERHEALAQSTVTMSSFLSDSDRLSSSGVQSQVHSLERHGSAFINRLTAAIREESLKFRLLALAWTAGPVTYLALYVGFSLGYGKQPPRELFIYFGVFTLITGLISIAAGVFKKATVEARRKAVSRMIAEVIARLPDLIIAVRNLGVMQLSPGQRRLRGVLYLLSDPDATESSIETAIEDLTGSRELARHFRRLESFRKKGLSILVREEAETIKNDHASELQAVAAQSDYISFLLESRLAGRIPSKRFGQRRKYGFLQRIIHAVNTGSEEGIELIDTMEMLKLILEFLMDREFTVLRWKLSGHHPMVDASKKLEQLVRQRQRLERDIRLSKYRVIQLLDSSINEGLTPHAPGREKVQDAPFSFTMAAMPKFDIPEDYPSRNGKHIDDLTAGLMKIRDKSLKLEKVKKKEMEARKTFSRFRHEYRASIPPYAEGDRPAALSVQFERSSVRFSHEDKIHFTENLQHYLRNLTSNRDRTKLFAENPDRDTQEENRSITVEELQGIALRIFAELENLLDLSEESVISALESSTAINVGAIEQGLTRKTKIGWLQALVEDMEDNESVLGLQTAKRLVDHFQCGLPLPVARSLSDRFHLPLQELLQLEPAEESEEYKPLEKKHPGQNGLIRS